MKVILNNPVGYNHLATRDYVHETVTHIEEQYSRTGSHQRDRELLESAQAGIEWHLCCRRAVPPSPHVDEQAFRYNNRAPKDKPLTDYDRFMLALSQISGKGLTYTELTGKVGETEGGDSPIF
jgi:hypothetical protein